MDLFHAPPTLGWARAVATLSCIATCCSALCLVADCSMDLNVSIADGNATFSGSCSTSTAPLVWCAFGITEDPSGGMYPAEVFFLQPNASETYAILEDRVNIGFAVPWCLQTQVSTLLSSSVIATVKGTVLSATWTRPLRLNASLITDGYVNIAPGPAAVISALHYEPPPIDPYVYCSKNLAIHEVAGQGTLNFTSNSTLSPTPSPAPEASRTLTSTATRTALPSPTASQSPTGGVSPSPAPSPLGPSLCIGSPCYNSVSWSISGPNITFGANCTLLGSASTGSNVVGWCGFGLSPTGLMVPAEAWILTVDRTTGTVVLEDRLNRNGGNGPTSECAPATTPNPVSTLIYGSYGATWIAARWTRPLALTAYQLGLGYLDVPTGLTFMISAMNWQQGPPPPYAACGQITIHNVVGQAPVTLVAQSPTQTSSLSSSSRSSSQTSTGGVSPTSSPSPLGPLKCIGSPCYNAVTWSVSGPNITFGANCTLVGGADTGSNVIGWCGLGLSPSGLMVPAEAWILLVDRSTGTVVLEDRMNQNSVSASSPTSACVPATNPNPVSTLVDGSYGATWIAATWTRPLALTEYQQGLGYLDIPTGPTYMISAINFQPGPALPYTPCGTIFTHVASGQAPVTFIAPLQAGKAELPQAEQFGITTGVLLVVLGGGVALLRYCQYRGERARAAANAAKSAEDYSALN